MRFPSVIFKVGFGVETSITMTYYVTSWCNANTIQRETNNYLMVIH